MHTRKSTIRQTAKRTIGVAALAAAMTFGTSSAQAANKTPVRNGGPKKKRFRVKMTYLNGECVVQVPR